ncbi:MAG: AI-2E family transporter [Verrucomicrobium sp.]|nr:AI-2E family transporter [Verrucomicrobium sp.]
MKEQEQELESETTTPRAMKAGRALLTLACVIVVIGGLKLAAPFLVPIVTAFFLSVLSYPLMNWLMKRRVPHMVALFLTVSVIVLSLGLTVWAGAGLLRKFQSEVPTYVHKLKSYVDQTGAWLEERGVEGAKDTANQVFDVPSIISLATHQDVMKNVASMVGTTFGTVATVLGSTVIVLVVMMFILMEAPGTKGRAEVVKQAGGPNLTVLLQSASDIQQYLGVKTLISAATGILVFILCWAFGLKYPLLWAILAFFFNYIPAVGSTVASVPAVIEALAQNGVGSAIGVMIGYALINFCLDSLLQPMLMGRRFGISGLVIVLSVIFWGWLWGAVGMFLAVPLTMMMKVIIENTDEFRWISVAMAKKKVRHGEVVLEMPDLEDEDLFGGGAATEPPNTVVRPRGRRANKGR